MKKEDLLKQSFGNRSKILSSTICGCYYCESIFSGSEIHSWIDDGITAECPVCLVDSVIYGGEGITITEELLEELYVMGFGSTPSK